MPALEPSGLRVSTELQSEARLLCVPILALRMPPSFVPGFSLYAAPEARMHGQE